MRIATSLTSTARLATRFTATAASALLASGALAHEGHGMEGASHWHITDIWGFVALAVVAGVTLWISRGGK